MNFSRNKVLIAVVCIGGGVLLFGKRNSVDNVDAQISASQEAINQRFLSTEGSTPLSNSNATLSTLIAQNKGLRDEVSKVSEKHRNLEMEIARIRRERERTDGNRSAEQDQTQLQIITELQSRIDSLTEMIQSKNETPTRVFTQEPNDTQLMVNDITGGDVQPIQVPVLNNKPLQDNRLLDMLTQPSSSTEDGVNFSSQEHGQQIDIVTVNQSDVVFEQDDRGNVQKVYPVNPRSKSHRDKEKQPSLLAEVKEEPNTDPVPIYTIPVGSTLFDGVAMSAIIGRVPINNMVSNPFRFKILIGSENLATNGHFIPNLNNMILTGVAEGDFTLECATGTINSATFTFNDGRVSTTQGELGKISDASGIPCIRGQYITNSLSYASRQGLLASLSAFASSIAGAAVTTSTNADGVTNQVVNDAGQKALGDGFKAGSDEIVRWYAERQQSAFDVVYVPPGESIVVNIDSAIHIDYEPVGRKLFHEENMELIAW